MERMIITEFEIDSLEKIEPVLPYRRPARLKIKVRMSLYDMAKLFSQASDDFTEDEINEALSRFDYKITDLTKTSNTPQP